MSRHLIVLLGKGQAVLTQRNEKYRIARYYFSDLPQVAFETPFVGEAIVHLKRSVYQKMHIFGTQDAQWDALLAHLIGDSTDQAEESYFFSLTDKMKEHTLRNDDLIQLASIFSKKYKIAVDCSVIPLGTDGSQMWEIFNTLISIPVDPEDAISIDITHSLRFHPVILLLSLFYYSSLRPDVYFGSLYYGALELAKKEKRSPDSAEDVPRAPIMKLDALGEMIQWINAATTFSRYDDPALLSRLIKKDESNDQLIQFLQVFSGKIQLNMLNGINTSAQQVSSELLRQPDTKGNTIPKGPLKQFLLEFPEAIVNQKSEYQKYFTIAHRHWRKGRKGLAILALWDSVIRWIASIKGVPDLGKDTMEKLSYQITNKPAFSAGYNSMMKNFAELRRYRNNIAHSNWQKQMSLDDFNMRMSQLFKEVPQYFNNAALRMEVDQRIQLSSGNQNGTNPVPVPGTAPGFPKKKKNRPKKKKNYPGGGGIG